MIRWALLGIIIATLSLMSYERNKTWMSEISLLEDVVTKVPLKERPWSNLSAAYILAGEYLKGKERGLRALKLDDKQYYIYYNLSIAEFNLAKTGNGNLQQSYNWARRAAEIQKDNVTLTQLGIVLTAMGYTLTEDKKYITVIQ